jgi:DNA-binding response OmpR family regulator
MPHTILVTEDDRALSGVLKHKLESEGFQTALAHDGQEALDLIHKGGLDLVLLDLTMPNIDGFQVLEEMQKQNASIPTIVMSSLSQPEDKQKVLGLGAKTFLVKTEVTTSSIVDEVKKTLNMV